MNKQEHKRHRERERYRMPGVAEAKSQRQMERYASDPNFVAAQKERVRKWRSVPANRAKRNARDRERAAREREDRLNRATLRNDPV